MKKKEEIEVYFCDVCGERIGPCTVKCKVCGKDLCYDHRRTIGVGPETYNFCPEHFLEILQKLALALGTPNQIGGKPISKIKELRTNIYYT